MSHIVPDLFCVIVEFLPNITDVNQFKRISSMHSNIAHKCITTITADEGVSFDDIREFKRLKDLQVKFVEALGHEKIAEAIKFVSLNKLSRVAIRQFHVWVLREKWKLEDAIKIGTLLNDVGLMTAIAPLCDVYEPPNWKAALRHAIYLGHRDVVDYITSAGNVEDWTMTMLAALGQGRDDIINIVKKHSGGKIDWNYILVTARQLQREYPTLLPLAESFAAQNV